jgi:type IV pilus assembly protein PilM
MDRITAIEFTDLECKVLQGERSKDRGVVRALFSVSLPRNEDAVARVAERAQLLRDALKAHKVKPQKVHIIIPKNYVMARMVVLPSSSAAEIGGMARFEAERHIAFNADRHIVSHHILSMQGVQGSQVLLAAVDRPIAQEYLDICLKAGLEVERLDVSSLAVFNALAFARRELLEGKVVALVNVGIAGADLVIANSGALIFTRGSSMGVARLLSELAEAVPQQPVRLEDLRSIDALEPQRFFRPPSAQRKHAFPGTEQPDEEPGASPPAPQHDAPFSIITDATPDVAAMPENKGALAFSNWLLRLQQEVKRTYEFAHREFNCSAIDHICVCGEASLIQSLPDYFQVNLGVETTVFNPLKSFESSGKTAEEVNARGALYAATAGAVAPQGPHTVTVNLVPPDYMEQKQAKRRQQSWIVSGILALAALVLGYFHARDLFLRQEEKLQYYRDKNKEYKTRVDDLDAKETRLNIIRTYIQDRHGALDILEQISKFKFIPEKVTLTRFEYRKEETVKVEGHARTLPDVNTMEAAIEKLGFFETVAQDSGSMKVEKLPNRAEQSLRYSITATLPKREAKQPKPSSSASGSQGGKTDGTE